MKIKQQLPSLIRSNSHQAGVTKAEQEKPLTANHCIDRQASPPTTSRSPAPLPSIPAHRLTCILRLIVHWPQALSLYASVRRDVFGGGRPSLATIGLRFSLQILLCGLCIFLSFCSAKEAPGTRQLEVTLDKTRVIYFPFPPGGGLRANITILTCFPV